MTRQEFSGLTTEALCDQLRKTYSGWESIWISVELVRRFLCGPPDYPGDPRSNCAVRRFQGVVGDVNGVSTVGYENKMWLPSYFEMPECPADLDVMIRGIMYYPNGTDDDGNAIQGDFTVNYEDRLLEFNTPYADMNGEIFTVRRFIKE